MDKRIKTICAIILVFAISFSFAIGVSAASITMTRYSQSKGNWCWAACALMLARSQGAAYMTQNDIVTYVKGSPVNEMGTIIETEQAVRYIANNSFSTIKGTSTDGNSVVITSMALKNKIDAGYPVIMGVKYANNTSAGGHMVVAYGYYTLSGKLYIMYHDPADDINGNDTSGTVIYENLTSSSGNYMESMEDDVVLRSYLSVLG